MFFLLLQFACKSDGRCVEFASRCDGIRDCDDGSDEEMCSGSLPVHFNRNFFVEFEEIMI